MRTRDVMLPTPPERPPYFRVQVDGQVYTLRALSPHRIAELARSLEPEQMSALLVLARSLGGGVAPGLAWELSRRAGPELIEVAGAAIGAAWCDPLYGFDASPPSSWSNSAEVRVFGAAVAEELHDAGWVLDQIARLGLALGAEIRRTLALEQEVQEQATFFVRSAAGGIAEPPKSSSGPASQPEEGSPA